jgi:hypothetical protein
MSDDFEAVLDEWFQAKKQPKVKPQYVPPPPPPKVELSLGQKRTIVEYMLGGVSKGIFEDCPEFWDGVVDIDSAYPSYRQAAEEFVEGLKQRLLQELS